MDASIEGLQDSEDPPYPSVHNQSQPSCPSLLPSLSHPILSLLSDWFSFPLIKRESKAFGLCLSFFAVGRWLLEGGEWNDSGMEAEVTSPCSVMSSEIPHPAIPCSPYSEDALSSACIQESVPSIHGGRGTQASPRTWCVASSRFLYFSGHQVHPSEVSWPLPELMLGLVLGAHQQGPKRAGQNVTQGSAWVWG